LNKLKACRERAALTQQELADVLKIDRSAISKWETGEFLPRTDKLPAIAKALGCTIDELLDAE